MLEIKNLSFSYDKESLVLNNLSLKVEQGDFLALVGPNGCGKTTLIKLISDILEKQEGTITFNRINNTDFKVKNSILYLPSDDVLPEFLTGQEYIELMLSLYSMSVDMYKIVKLAKHYSFESALDVLVEEYSNGMKKKVQIIAAMLIDPAILIIDETLNGLDVESKEITKLLLMQFIGPEKTIIMCSHDLHLLEEMCNKVVILYAGELYTHKNMDAVQKTSSLISIFREIIDHGEFKNEITAN